MNLKRLLNLYRTLVSSKEPSDIHNPATRKLVNIWRQREFSFGDMALLVVALLAVENYVLQDGQGVLDQLIKACVGG